MSDITLLDGSIGQELMKRSGDQPTTIWSIQVMMDHPGMVSEVHQEYFRAGATLASTNTYCVHRDRLEKVEMDPDLMPGLIDKALSEAAAARAAAGGGRLAGCLGPLEASYRPDIKLDPDFAAGVYAEEVALMKDRIDFFLMETVSSLEHAIGAMRGTKGCGKPVWLSMTVNDEDGTRLRSGEALTDLAPIVEAHQPEAVLINCSRPEAMEAALDIVKGFGKPFGAYANGFTHISAGFLKAKPTVDALSARTDLGPQDYARFVMGWIGQGATIVGGCCEVGPEHIAELARQLRAAGHRIV